MTSIGPILSKSSAMVADVRAAVASISGAPLDEILQLKPLDCCGMLLQYVLGSTLIRNQLVELLRLDA